MVGSSKNSENPAIVKTLAEAQSAIAEAQDQSVRALRERAQFVAKIAELEDKLAAADGWALEKQRYEMQAAKSGAFFYSLKADAQPAEPEHRICARCYQNGRKSVLRQMEEVKKDGEGEGTSYGTTHHCPECLFDVVV